MGPKEWFLLMLLSLIWGGSFFFNEIILRQLPPLTLVLGRTGLGALFLLMIVRLSGHKMPTDWATWRSFFVIGFLNNLLPFGLIVWGQQHIDSGMASILNATTPLFSVVLAHFLTREESFTLNRGLGVVLGLFGVMVLIGLDAFSGGGMSGVAQLAILGASFSYGLGAIYGRRFKGMPPTVPAAGMLFCASLMALPAALILDKPWQLTPDMGTWSALLGLAILSTVLAYMIYFHILAVAGATNILLVTFIIPISATFLGVVFLGEQIGWSMVFGAVLILLGLLSVDGRLLKKLNFRPKKPSFEPN